VNEYLTVVTHLTAVAEAV